MTREITRLGAYAVCVDDLRLLLVHQTSPGPAADKWTLPGGGVDFGEHPADAVIREVREETGGTAEVGSLLGVHDNVYELSDGVRRHGVRLLFSATVAGDLRPAAEGEISDVGWHPLHHLPAAATDWARLAANLVGLRGVGG